MLYYTAQSFFCKISVTCLFGIALLTSNAQFVDVTAEQLGISNINEGTIYGNGVSFFDFDLDGDDDLSLADGMSAPLFFVNNNHQLEPIEFGITNPQGSLVHMILWADYDNDGDNDLLITRHGAPLQLWRNEGSMSFVEVASISGLETASFEYWGAAFADYDHDGCLDLFVAKYYHPTFFPGSSYRSRLYHNNCDGTFTEVTVSAGINLPPRPCFQPVFFDYNNDGWEDLFLVIDRIQFQNELYRNNGDGTFSNVTVMTGVNQNICSMTGTVGDYDHDLDEDIYVTNGPQGNILLRNNNGENFTNVATDAGLAVNQVCWGSVWIDYDNNTWEDLYVGITSPVLPPVGNYFFINNEGQSFTNDPALVGLNEDLSQTHQLAKGDLNGDGYYDVIQNNRVPFPSKLWQNTGGENHNLAVTLEGIYSNKNGVGSKIKCFAGGQQWIQSTRCGENFLGQNSSKIIFGLANYTLVDSLIVEWNSGIQDVFYSLPVDHHYHIIESNILTSQIELNADKTTLCAGQSAVLDAGDYTAYHWSNGATTRTIEVAEPGIFQAWVTSENNVTYLTLPIAISLIESVEPEFTISYPTCNGYSNGTIVLLPNNMLTETFQLFDTQNAITQPEQLRSGEYSYHVMDIWQCAHTGILQIVDPSSIEVTGLVSDSNCNGMTDGNVELSISGGTPPYSVDWYSLTPGSLAAGIYEIGIYDSNNCSVNFTFEVEEPLPLGYSQTLTNPTLSELGLIQIEPSGGTPPYSIYWPELNLNDFMIDNLDAGLYAFVLQDNNACQVIVTLELILNSVYRHEEQVGLIQVYPNPAGDFVTLTFDKKRTRDFSIHNAHGIVCWNSTSGNELVELNTSQLASGIYVIEIQENQQRQFIKLIVEH